MRLALRLFGLRWAVLFAVLAVCAETASATTVIIPADDDMIVGARAIVRGRVLAINCDFDPQGRIYTYVTLRVNDVLKGHITARRIVLKEPGGQVGSQGSLVFGAPQFKPDEEVLLYLDTWNDGSLRVHQMFLGKFAITSDAATGKVMVTRDGPDAGVVFEERPHADGTHGPATSRMELGAYTEMVRARLALNRERARDFERTYYANVALLTEPPGYSRAAAGGVHAEFNFITNPPVRWFEPDSNLPVAFSVNLESAPPGAIDDVAAAMNAWSTIPGCAMRAVIGNTGNYCFARGLNTITFNNCDGQFAPTPGCASVLAIGGLNWDAGQTRVVGGVTFYAGNTGHVSFNPYASCDYDDHCKVREIATHEIGHALGLGHSWNPCGVCPPPNAAQQEATMYGIAHFDGRCATLKQDDTNGILFMYPAAGAGPGPLTIITPAPLQFGFIDSLYSQSLIASGGTPPYRWSLKDGSGSLPPGLVFNPTGLVGGTPTTEGTYAFTVQVTDAASATSQKDFTITITRVSANLNASFASQEVPARLEPGQSFAAVIRFINSGAQPWILSTLYLRSQNPTDNGVWGGNIVPIYGDSVVPGDTLEARFFAFAPRTPGVYDFQWQLYQDGQGYFGQMSTNVRITVGDGVPPLAISSAATAEAVQGQSFTMPLAATGGTSPYTWTVTAGVLPQGLSLNRDSGLLAGLPIATGTATCTVTVSDAQSRRADQVMTITVHAPPTPPLDLTTAQLVAGQQGVGYNQSLAAAGGKPPYTWSIADGSLPAGLALNATSGSISGTPNVSGTFNITVAVADAEAHAVRKALTLTVNAPALTMQLATLVEATLGQAFSYLPAAAGGRQPYSWAITAGALPAGLTLNAASGAISGTPTAAGSFAVTVTVRDADGRSAGGSLTIKVTDPATVPAITNVKYKGGKKLMVFGERFNAAAVLMIDGAQVAANPSDGTFVVKRLTLSAGAHEFKVINPGGIASAPFILTIN
ncbi:MAG TPA: putative Ig domain-containing protein [Blastocatellia bacterium]|nr:putative Ig domain-containing protein [Blastocatellia bacterium]